MCQALFVHVFMHIEYNVKSCEIRTMAPVCRREVGGSETWNELPQATQLVQAGPGMDKCTSKGRPHITQGNCSECERCDP